MHQNLIKYLIFFRNNAEDLYIEWNYNNTKFRELYNKVYVEGNNAINKWKNDTPDWIRKMFTLNEDKENNKQDDTNEKKRKNK